MALQTIKLSTVFVAIGGQTKVYPALEEVPAETRRKLMEATTGVNSATILIADRAGREQIVRALRGLPSQVQARMVSTKFPWTQAFERRRVVAQAKPSSAMTPPQKGRRLRPLRPDDVAQWMRRHWLEMLAPCVVAGALWVLLNLY